MPLYSYVCTACEHEFDKVRPLREYNKRTYCPVCGNRAKRVITLGHGGIHRDEAPWINDGLRMALQDPSEKPIETRTDLKNYLKAHPNIEPTG